jgi:putative transposase
MDASFCVSALAEALARFGKPEIFNTDRGSQFRLLGACLVIRHAGR